MIRHTRAATHKVGGGTAQLEPQGICLVIHLLVMIRLCRDSDNISVPHTIHLLGDSGEEREKMNSKSDHNVLFEIAGQT